MGKSETRDLLAERTGKEKRHSVLWHGGVFEVLSSLASLRDRNNFESLAFTCIRVISLAR